MALAVSLYFKYMRVLRNSSGKFETGRKKLFPLEMAVPFERKKEATINNKQVHHHFVASIDYILILRNNKTTRVTYIAGASVTLGLTTKVKQPILEIRVIYSDMQISPILLVCLIETGITEFKKKGG